MYFENRKAPLQFGIGDFVHPPCGIAHFPKEILLPPTPMGGARVQSSTMNGAEARRPLRPRWNNRRFWLTKFGRSSGNCEPETFLHEATFQWSKI
jgi:hypothetical protein